MPKPKKKNKPKEQPPEESVDNTSMTFLAVMGILGLILIGVGVVAVFLVSLLVGAGLITLGVVVYLAFYIVEKRLKII
ncbi:MAG: hypothetical protein ACM3UY_11210 [Methanocella sp.]